VARSKNGVIGLKGGLPWKLPADLAHFKHVTVGHPILMGRRTHESIGKSLPDRLNIVLSRSIASISEGAVHARSISEALELALISIQTGEMRGPLMVIGGAGVYKSMLESASQIELTEVDAEIEGDVFFPLLDETYWNEIARTHLQADSDNSYDLIFRTLVRLE